VVSIDKELGLSPTRALPDRWRAEHVHRARRRPERVRSARLGELSDSRRHSLSESEQHVRSVVGHACGRRRFYVQTLYNAS
jgi:hypothetical protein